MNKFSDMKIVGGCGGGTCPTLYKSDDGRYFIQGYKLDENNFEKDTIPANEDVVEISESLLMEITNEQYK